MSEPNYTLPTVQADLEKRLEEGDVPHGVLIKGTDPTPSENGYVGVDPIYQNYADVTHKPFRAGEESPEAVFEDALYSEDADFDAGATPESVEDAEDDEDYEDEEEETPSSNTPGVNAPTLP